MKAGFHTADITPARGMEVPGGFDKVFARRIYDPLKVRAAVFEDEAAGILLAFVGVDGARARFNTIYRPKRWALRILQETRAPGFVPSRNGVFTDNLVVFRSDEWVEGGVNVGPDTAPQTFRFARNLWHCLDDPSKSRPALPAPETGGVYGKDPGLRDPANGDLRPNPRGPGAKIGAAAFRG